MAYLFGKVFPFVWPYLKEYITGWLNHPYFKRHGYKIAIRKFGLILLFIAFIFIGTEYVATLRELELIKAEVKTAPPAYVSFEDVKNYHTLFNSPETQRQLNQCQLEIYSVTSQLTERTHALDLERQLHIKTKEELELLRRKPTLPATAPSSNRDSINQRLNPKKDPT